MKVKTGTIYALSFCLALALGSLLGLACTPAERQQAADNVKQQAEACAEEPIVKACVNAALATCTGDDRADCPWRVIKCFDLCSHPLGEAGARSY
jgi:hypothetical protein